MAAPLSRADAVKMLMDRSRQAGLEQENFSNEFYRRIVEGKVIPVISNSFRLEQIFRSPLDPDRLNRQVSDRQTQNIENLLTQGWASDEIRYPLVGYRDLARVAQYKQIMAENTELAKVSYLHFMKIALLLYAGYSRPQAEVWLKQQEQNGVLSFTELAGNFNCPQFIDLMDPLKILADLPLTIYVTTSFHTFMEKALVQVGKEPVTQVCYWSGVPAGLSNEDEILKDYIPSVEKPLVYHLYGLERYPNSLVISEDDYLDYLNKITHDLDPEHPVLPMYLRSALSTYSLLMLGYRPSEWDFRILFRGVLNALSRTNWINLIVQPPPEQQYPVQEASDARRYLKTYFDPAHFKVEWNSSEIFLSQLWDTWNAWRMEQ